MLILNLYLLIFICLGNEPILRLAILLAMVMGLGVGVFTGMWVMGVHVWAFFCICLCGFFFYKCWSP